MNLERAINLFPEIAPGMPKAAPTLRGSPGLTPFVALPGGPGRGMFAQDGRCWAVAGATVWELASGQTAQIRGLIPFGTAPVTWACNGQAGHQLLLCADGVVYILDLISGLFYPTAAANLLGPLTSIDFLNGYGLALNSAISTFYTSALEDFLTWDPAEANQVSTASNAVVRLLCNREDVWLFGNVTSSTWGATGDLNQPFAPIPGALIVEFGTVGRGDSAVIMDNTVWWVGQSPRGNGVVYVAQGYTPVAVSTPAVETFLQKQPRLEEVVGWTYQQDGHSFYTIAVPDAETAWVFDSRQQVWHERGRYDAVNQTLTLPRAIFHAFAFGQHLVQDRLTGTVSTYTLDAAVDTVPA